jgi:hypothetical protein
MNDLLCRCGDSLGTVCQLLHELIDPIDEHRGYRMFQCIDKFFFVLVVIIERSISNIRVSRYLVYRGRIDPSLGKEVERGIHQQRLSPLPLVLRARLIAKLH